MDDGLDYADHVLVKRARLALVEFLRMTAPAEQVMPLAIVAISGSFADILTASTGAKDLAAIINQQIQQSGWRLVPLRNN